MSIDAIAGQCRRLHEIITGLIYQHFCGSIAHITCAGLHSAGDSNVYSLLTKFHFGIPDKRPPRAAAPASAARRHHGCTASCLSSTCESFSFRGREAITASLRTKSHHLPEVDVRRSHSLDCLLDIHTDNHPLEICPRNKQKEQRECPHAIGGLQTFRFQRVWLQVPESHRLVSQRISNTAQDRLETKQSCLCR